MIVDLLRLLDIPPDLPAAEKAAAVVRCCALRREATAPSRDVASVVESRWFSGTAECARFLGELFRGSMGRGAAFGGPWPFLQAGGRVVAPALPVVASATEAAGPDGSYRFADGAVRREAVGEERPFLSTGRTAVADGVGFDLMWFGAGERYLVRDGILEIEDLFSALRLPATAPVVRGVLAKTLRVDAEVLSDLPFAPRDGAGAEVEVRRPLELVGNERWREPAEVLSARPGIRKVTQQADRLVAETEGGTELVFVASEEPAGWQLFSWEGDHPLRTLAMRSDGDVLCFRGILRPGLDPLTPGLRQRLAFDLRSDLVALG